MLGGKRKQGDFSAEIEAYLQLEADRLRDRGFSEEEARVAARRAFGKAVRARNRFDESGRWVWLDHLTADLRYAVRVLVKAPRFTLAVLAALALGIGANTAVFTVINTVLLHPLPYPDSDRIVSILRQDNDTDSIPMFTYWQQNDPGFDDLAAYDGGSNSVNVSGGDRPELVQALKVSVNYFRLFGANPILGRTFSAEEDRPGGPQALMMSYALWQRRFGGDPSILGKTITLGGAPYSVVGVLAPHFKPYPPTDVWMALKADPASTDQAHIYMVSGRLRRGVTLAQANSRMALIGKRYVQARPEQLGNDDKLKVSPMRQQITGDVKPTLLILLGAVGLVLLIACANVANLLLARGTDRQKEIAVRAAIGAGRGRIMRQLLTESLLLALAGGILGLGLGSWGVGTLLALTPGDLPRVQEMASFPALDPWVAGFSVLLAAITGVIFGLFPALQLSRIDLASSLKESGGRAGTGLKHNRTLNVLVAAEMAIAVVLLCGAVLLIRSFAALHRVDPGFDPHDLLTLNISLDGEEYASARFVDRLAQQLTERLERIPGVQAAALTNGLPFERAMDMIFDIPGRPPLRGYKFTGDVLWVFVSPHYFDTLQIPLRSGRLFRRQEPAHTVVINEALARKFWPGQNPVGQSILIGAGLGPKLEQGPTEVVGIVGDVRPGLDATPYPIMYQVLSQIPDEAIKLVNAQMPAGVIVRTKAGVAPLSVSREVQKALLTGDTELPATNVQTMEQVMLDSTSRQNFNLLLLGVFAGIALLLAAVGIYGVMSYSVEQRTHEIGIRAALGASPLDTLKLVLGQAVRLALGGVAAGVAAAFGLTRLMSSQLFAVKPADPLTLITVPLILLLLAVAAAYVPALRASRVDPLAALRHE